MNLRVSLLAVVLLLGTIAHADVVDSEPLGVPYFGNVSRSGCVAYINWYALNSSERLLTLSLQGAISRRPLAPGPTTTGSRSNAR
jgi:hypothetical protein